MAEIQRAQSEPVELEASKKGKVSSRSAGLYARKGFAETLDRILHSSSRPDIKVRQQQQPDRVQQPSVIVGPVIGKVTCNSARVLIEINRNAFVTAVLEPQTQDYQLKKPLQHSWGWRSLPFKRKQSSIAENEVLDLDEHEQVPVSVIKELKSGRPGVFHFTNLTPNTRYKVDFKGCHYSISGSFKTLEISAAKQGLNLGIISCNNVYITHKAIPIHSDLWEHLYKNINAGKVDYLLHLGDQIYADVDEADDDGSELNRFETAKSMLGGLTSRQQWEQHEQGICELYRRVYRDTWQHLPTAKCLASCPNLMILDDHEIRDNWGDLPQDWERDSVEFFIARCAWIAYLEYQRQLHEDIDFSNLEDIHKEYHFHVLGGLGLMFVDIRGSRTFHRVEGDENAYLGSEQWKDISDSLSFPGGFFNGVKALVLCATAPLAFLEPNITNVAAKRVDRLEDFKGHWSAQPHTQEQIRMIDSLVAWKAAQPGREVVVLGGDVHCGGHSDVLKDKQVVFQQLTSSAMANTSLPKTAYYFMRLVGRLGGSLNTHYTFRHYHWTRSRNYGLVGVRFVQRFNPEHDDEYAAAEISTQLVKGKFMRGILLGAKVHIKRTSPRARTCCC